MSRGLEYLNDDEFDELRIIEKIKHRPKIPPQELSKKRKEEKPRREHKSVETDKYSK